MDANIEREGSALGGLFQQIITDMKVCNALNDSTSAECYICGAKPSEMNDLSMVMQKEVDRSTFKFGLSTLHAHIRIFEALIKIAYRLDSEQWKNGAPLWEDLISKATKLHSCLRAAILAISAYLEAFQKIADSATNARGATKEIGTALTRICLRHKAVETRMKSFTSAVMDCLVLPLQEKLEDWKKSLINLDKEHAKEYKKARAELKKRSTDTLRLQKKKARKTHIQSSMQSHGHANSALDSEFNKLLESSAAVVQEKRLSLEETERRAVRAALLEERGRFCLLARFLKPVLDEEIAMLMELTHLQEVSDQLQRHAASPHHLPPASEQVITDVKGCDPTHWSLATPPSSPSLSLGSRKSSMCSISSLTSSSSGSCKSHPSPSGHPWHRSLTQPLGIKLSSIGSIVTIRHLTNASSRDSGFISQDTLYSQPISEDQVSNVSSQYNQNSEGTVVRPVTTFTWPDLKESSNQFEGQNQNAKNERPHTISSAYEKGHQRPVLSVYTFQAPDRDSSSCSLSQPASPVSSSSSCSFSNQQTIKMQLRKNSGGNRPPIPSRCSSLERPSIPTKSDSSGSPRAKAKLPLPAHLTKELAPHQLQQPMYVNMHELASLAASRAQEMHIPLLPPPTNTAVASTNEKTDSTEKDGGSQTSESSIESSSGYGSQTTLPHSHSIHNQTEGNCNVPSPLVARRGSIQQVTRPHPPTRRISAIMGSNFSSLSNQGNDEHCGNTFEDTENLPPPPAFLLEGSSPNASPTPQRSISVSETVRTLTELRHTPASPSLLRKVTGQSHNAPTAAVPHNTVLQITRSSVERSSTVICSSQESSSSISSTTATNNQNPGPGGIGHSFMAVLSAKLISTSTIASNVCSSSGSPKSSKKNSAEHLSNKHAKTNPGFLETLNAKLAQQQPLTVNSSSSRSASVRRIMGNRMPIIDPIQVRDSLMDQIRRGTPLRKTSGPINDRSAPRIY